MASIDVILTPLFRDMHMSTGRYNDEMMSPLPLKRAQDCSFYIDWSQRCRVTTLADILELRFFYSNPFSWDTWRNYNITFMSVNKSTLGRITPLGRPRSVQGRHGMPFLESKGPNDLARQDLWTHFSIPAVRIHRCIFGANLVILAQTHYKLSRGQVKYPRILCQNDDIF